MDVPCRAEERSQERSVRRIIRATAACLQMQPPRRQEYGKLSFADTGSDRTSAMHGPGNSL